MITYGVYRLVDGTSYDIVVEHTKKKMEVLLGQNGAVVSAYKKTADFEGAFNNKDANNIAKVLNTAVTGCTARNGYPTVFALGACSQHTFKRSGINFEVSKFSSELCGAYITSDTFNVELRYNEQSYQMPNIEYVKYSHRADLKVANEDNEEIPVRSLEEIALTKDITWLKNKKYYIVNDEEQAEQIFTFLDNFNGTISYDTETTGLRINMFCQIGSEKKKQIEEYNKKQKEAGQPVARVDRLVGMIYCVQEGVSYYFPCFNRKFKNLYDNVENPTTKKVTDRILSDYTIGKYRDRKDCMAEFIRNTPVKDWGSDVILMERNRNILSTKNLLAHNGKFEWKVCWNYNIDFHLVDDTIIEHQLLYKYKVATTNRGERSDLKFLTKKELGCDQLELTDFFAGFSEDDTGIVNTKSKRANKSKVKIDFSYMDYDGARAYAPADGDFTLGIYHKYKKDLVENHPELDYLYRVEVLVSQAMAYMEYYGHRIDPLKIDNIRKDYEADKIKIEHKLRQLINYSEQDEENIFNEIESIENKIKELKADTEDHKEEVRSLYNKKEALQVKAQQIMDESVNSLNLGSPAQVADLFYNKLGIKCPEEKQSINKKILKGFLKEKNEDGTIKYPVVKLYKDWKDKDTALSKFFGNLPDYMYPGGFIFSDFGQIAAATGRMTCKHPNAQQYPKAITAIVKPRDGFVMIDADFSQIEYRTLVALAHEESLLEKFKDPDMDYHTTMAALMYGVDYASVTPKQRSEAKSFNFGIPYGMGFGSLAILLTGINTEATRAEAEYKYELYFKDQPNVRQYFRDIKEMAVVRGYTQTKWGRRRYFSFTDKDGNYSNALKARALRQAGNAVIQGCLDGDTRIQTKEFGIVKIKDVVNRHLMVWDGDKWSNGDILYSGKKQKCIVTFTTGQKFVCSPIHKFLVRSHKGNDRFVECKDLIGSNISNNPHRVVVNPEYVESDFIYNSEWAYDYMTFNHQSKNALLEQVGDSFRIGEILGRIASDGSVFDREVGGKSVRHIVAEHEINILPELRECMKNLGFTEKTNEVREGRNQRLTYLDTYSSSLVKEISALDVKHQVHDNIFMDTEVLRGFLRGFFDGDGGLCKNTVRLTFGNQFNFEPMCRDIQKALLFFGIRSRYHRCSDRYVIDISTYDNKRFAELIGFINNDKQDKLTNTCCVNDEHIFGRCLRVESVEITDEYIDMYDVCNTDGGYYVADGIITHNTAADIFKIGVARNFSFIRKNNLFGKMLIVNMIHDEQLIEADARELNIKAVVSALVQNMEMKIEGFPPLYVGAGVGLSWKDAKGKMNEINPRLAEQFINEASTEGLYVDAPRKPEDVLDYFNSRVFKFRENKILEYVRDENNRHKALHPVIGNLLSLQFDYGVNEEVEAEYTEENGYSSEEIAKAKANIPIEQLKRFLADRGITDIDAEWFKAEESNTSNDTDDDEDVEYEDEDEEDEDEDGAEESGGTQFRLIDESNKKLYGIDIRDVISEFGVVVSKEQRICGIDATKVRVTNKDKMAEYIQNHASNDPEADMNPSCYEVVFLLTNNAIKHTGGYVCNINQKDLAKACGFNSTYF